MNTFMTVTLYSSSSKRGETVCHQIQSRVDELEQILSTTLPSSDVFFINHNSNFPASLKPELQTLIDFSKLIYEKTEGAFNPAL